MSFLFWNKKKDKDKPTTANQVSKVAVSQIIPNRFQPRQVFSQQKISELAETIKEHGLLQPIVLREYEPQKYEIIAGERRFRAVRYLGWEEVDAIVKQMDDTEAASMAVIENLQREGLTSIEEAQAYQHLLELNHLTQTQLADQLGKSQSFIANKLRLLKLSEPVQESILKRQISERHGRALLKLNEEQQVQMVQEIIKNHLSVKETENQVADFKMPCMHPKRSKIKPTINADRALTTIEKSVKTIQKKGLAIKVQREKANNVEKVIIEIPLNNKEEKK